MQNHAPELRFLPEERKRQIENAILKATERSTIWAPDFSPELKTAVDYLQTERRLRLSSLDDLREQRRHLRRRIRGAAPATHLSQEKHALEAQIEIRVAEIKALTDLLVPLRSLFGENSIAAAAAATARATNTRILLRDVPPAAAGRLMHKGVGKGMNAKFHSAQDGVIAGLIPYQQRLSRKVAREGTREIEKMQALVEEALARGEVFKIKFRVGAFAAVEREGEVKFIDFTKEKIDESEIVEILGVMENNSPRTLVSDVDPLAFGVPSDSLPEIPAMTQKLGVLTPREAETISTFNHLLSKFLGRSEGTFIAHGAENRNPYSSGITGYPIRVYYPNGRMKTILEGPAENPDLHLQKFFEETENDGFRLDINPRWGWPEPPILEHGTVQK